MKTITIPCMLFAVALLPLCAQAQQPKAYKPEELTKIPTLTLDQEAEIVKNVGKIVKLQFDHKYEGSTANKVHLILEVVINGSWRTGTIALSVPPAGEKWAASLKTTGNAVRAREFVYARVVSKDNAEALGTKIVTGSKGKELTW